MRRRLTLLTVLLLPALALAASRVYYKWTDVQGVVHYSETPPSGHTYQRVQVDGATPSPTGSGQHAAAPAPASTAALARAERDYRRRACTAASGDVKRLSGKGLVVSGRGDQARALHGTQRAKALAEARARVKQYCDGRGAP